MRRPNFKRIFIALSLAVFYAGIGYQSWEKSDPSLASADAQKQIVAYSTAYPNSNLYGNKRAALAIAEYQKGVREATPGCNCGPEIDKYTLGLNLQWCAMFASWVMRESGTPLTNDVLDDSWRKTKARTISTWLGSNGTWYSREEALAKNIQPQVGDVIVFWRGNYEGDLGHADIVVAVDKNKPGFADLIGGNLGDRVSYRKDFFYAEHYGFLGFGRPNDPEKVISQL